MAVCGTSCTVGALIAYGYRSVAGWVHTVHLLSNLWPSLYTVHSPTGYMDILILNTYSARPLPLHDNSMSNTFVVVVEGDNSSTTSHCKRNPMCFFDPQKAGACEQNMASNCKAPAPSPLLFKKTIQISTLLWPILLDLLNQVVIGLDPLGTMTGTFPTFFLVPVTLELSNAAITGQYPKIPTQVLCCATALTHLWGASTGMEDTKYRKLALKRFPAFKTLAKNHWVHILEGI